MACRGAGQSVVLSHGYATDTSAGRNASAGEEAFARICTSSDDDDSDNVGGLLL